ncbi:MAG: RNA polymerase sigma factor [Bacteroidetes bacterium]|nr:MAG: RNA polymerase sigma factor [Bacteroidota bacterium]
MQILRKKYGEFTDEQLMQYLSKGDKRAFDELYARYSRAMLIYFKRMLWNDQEKAEDFMHDLFAKIIKKPESFDRSRNFKTWFYSVANNMCKNEYKKQEVRKNTSYTLDTGYQIKDHQGNVEREVQESMFQQAFEEKLEELDEKHSEVFKLRHFDGLSIKEIAGMLGANEGTVKSRLFYATKYLASGLQEFNPILNR